MPDTSRDSIFGIPHLHLWLTGQQLQVHDSGSPLAMHIFYYPHDSVVDCGTDRLPAYGPQDLQRNRDRLV